MVSNSAKLDHRTKQHTEFGVSASNGSRDMARTKVAKKNERRQSHKASPTGIANERAIKKIVMDNTSSMKEGRRIQLITCYRNNKTASLLIKNHPKHTEDPPKHCMVVY